MDGIYDDKDLIHIGKTDSLINIASYSKKFSFSRHNIYHIMYSLDDWFIVAIDI